jgi:hypothetical protein
MNLTPLEVLLTFLARGHHVGDCALSEATGSTVAVLLSSRTEEAESLFRSRDKVNAGAGPPGQRW